MAVTDSDGATASQKCDPYAEGFEECESFLRGEDDVMRKQTLLVYTGKLHGATQVFTGVTPTCLSTPSFKFSMSQ